MDWKILPEDGGFFDQSKKLMDDVLTIEWRCKIIEAHLKTNNQQQQTPEKNGLTA